MPISSAAPALAIVTIGAAVCFAAGSASAASTSGLQTSVLPISIPGGPIYEPAGVAADGAGHVYLSDTYANVIARYDGTSTSVAAGSFSSSGESGDGGPATSATLASPEGLAVDRTGDLYIADTDDETVREITTDGGIRLVAGDGIAGYSGDGGAATSAELDDPTAVAVDDTGDVFIADAGNNAVREVRPDGTISTFAGSGPAGYTGDGGPATQAELNFPQGVAVDSEGNVYIADSANAVIRRVSAVDGTISTVAGNFAASQAVTGAGGDGGPATSAQLYDPQGIAVDRAGDLFVADTFNNEVREVTSAGIISTISSTGLNTPEAVSVDNSTGDVYVANTAANDIVEVSGLPLPATTGPGPVAPSQPGTQVPESPATVALPLTALGLIGAAAGLRRLRRSPGGHA